MRQSFGNARFHRAMALFSGVIGLGFLVGAGVVLGSNKVGGGIFLLVIGLLFGFWSWFISPRRTRRISADRLQRRRDRLNAFFSFLRIGWAVDPEWKDRQEAGK